jgi:bifunctional non-homologous end joining protein LigD
MPMPQSIAPMLATLAADLPSDPARYSFEYKWDGVRGLCFWDGTRLRLRSRNLLDITPNYPELHALGPALGKHRQAILDGEIVALNASGLPSFQRLQHRMHVAHPSQTLVKEYPVVYMLFDVLYAGGRSVVDAPLERRRELLESMTLKGPSWQVSPAYVGEGRTMLESARRIGMEGVVAKLLGSCYEPGRRSAAWQKIKVIFGQEFVIGGWVPQAGNLPPRVGSLLVGYYQGQGRDRALRYAGAVGSGFSEVEHALLLGELSRLTRATSPFADRVPKRDAIFVAPQLVAEVEYRRWPADGMVQQAAYKGLRWDKPATSIVKERPEDACVPADDMPP